MRTLGWALGVIVPTACQSSAEPAVVDDLSECSIAEELCPVVELCEENSCSEPPFEIVYSEAQECAFSAFAAQEMGLIRVESACDEYGCVEDLLLLSGGTQVLRRTQMEGSLAVTRYVCNLAEPSEVYNLCVQNHDSRCLSDVGAFFAGCTPVEKHRCSVTAVD